MLYTCINQLEESVNLHKGLDLLINNLPTNWALIQGHGALFACRDMVAGPKEHGTFSVETDLAFPLFLRLLQLFLLTIQVLLQASHLSLQL